MDPTENEAIEPTEVPQDLGTGGEAEAVETPAFEYPDNWTKETRSAVEAMLAHPEGRPWAEQWRNQWKSAEEQQRKLQGDRDRYRAHAENYSKWQQMLSPYEQQYRMHGIPIENGVMQAMEWSKAIQANPQQALSQLAQMYGVDFSKAEETADQPYVDPHVKQLQQQYQRDMGSVQNAIQGVIGYIQQRETQQQIELAEAEIKAFAEQVDETGAPSHPYFTELDQNELIQLVRAGYKLDRAYKIACMENESVARKIEADKAKKAAAVRQTEAQKATGAVKALSPAGKAATTTAKRPRDAGAAIEEALRELTG